ncbi:MAG: glutaredoxin domain-containing protein [Candidatus Nanoarchaeia archaeon]|nr:glutaredoxin domain-containing protein [Candidatus Nanoarchaeia archaeon]
MKKVILYTSMGCPFCLMVKKYLEKNEIQFKEIDIIKDEKSKNEMIEKSGQKNIPVLDVDGNIIIGYNIKEMKKYLEI